MLTLFLLPSSSNRAFVPQSFYVHLYAFQYVVNSAGLADDFIKMQADVAKLVEAQNKRTSHVSNTKSRAEATVENRRKGILTRSNQLDNVLNRLIVKWWPSNLNDKGFPSSKDKETKTCQPYVTSVLKLFNKGFVGVSEVKKGKSSTRKVNVLNVPFIEAYSTPTVGKKRPDCVFHEPDKTGNTAITLLGEVKGGGQGEFSDEDIGQLTDVTERVMKYQPYRQFMITFLTDGRRFQFYQCHRSSSNFTFQFSSIYFGKKAWQVKTNLKQIGTHLSTVHPCCINGCRFYLG